MPVYTYRREDGTTFDIRQKFADDPLEVDPETGQKVVRVVHAAGIIFKGSGFYVNDSKSANKTTLNANGNGKAETKAEDSSDTKAETKSESKSETSDSTTKTETAKPAKSESKSTSKTSE